MIEVVKSAVVLPLKDAGKPKIGEPSAIRQPGGAGWRKALFGAGLLGVGLVAGAALRPMATELVLWANGLDPIQSASTATTPAANVTAAALPEVVALGRLVPAGGLSAVAPPNGGGDARIARLLVAEGDRVQAGQVVAELDNLPQLLATKASAESTLSAQEAALDQVRASVAASLAEARADRASAEAALVLARQDLARLTKLAERNLTTQVLLQQAQSNAVKAAADLDRTTAQVERHSAAPTGGQPDIVLAERNVDLARNNLARATEDLAAARVIAARSGTVLEIIARVGEKPSDSGVARIGDIDNMTAELEVYQTDIARVAPGQVAEMSARALPEPLTGRITAVGKIVGRQSVMSSEPAANADARVIKVIVTLDAASSLRARSFTNLEVIGRIRKQAP